MSDNWTWDYDPDAEHVVGGLPHEVVAEVERLAEQLTVLGRDAVDVGRGNPHGGGLRTQDIFGGRGFFMFMALERLELVVITRVTGLADQRLRRQSACDQPARLLQGEPGSARQDAA